MIRHLGDLTHQAEIRSAVHLEPSRLQHFLHELHNLPPGYIQADGGIVSSILHSILPSPLDLELNDRPFMLEGIVTGELPRDDDPVIEISYRFICSSISYLVTAVTRFQAGCVSLASIHREVRGDHLDIRRNRIPGNLVGRSAQVGISPDEYLLRNTPPGCVGCVNYYGRFHGNTQLICGMHPYGNGESCEDFEVKVIAA